jgi:hypothetical protein
MNTVTKVITTSTMLMTWLQGLRVVQALRHWPMMRAKLKLVAPVRGKNILI